MPTIAEALTVAIEQHRGGQLQAAEQIYRQILQVEPNQPDALHLLGVIAAAVGKLEIATHYMRRALHVRPDYPEAHNNLGMALAAEQKLDEAVICYQRAIHLEPAFAQAHLNLGMAFRDQGKLDEAIACYGYALALRPDYAEAHGNLGIALREQGKLEEAIASYRRAVELNPDQAEAHSNLGVALSDQGNLDDAISCYQRALALKPDFTDAHNNLGIAFCVQGNLREAAACYQQALVWRPDDADAHWNQALLMLLAGDFERGWAEYEWRWHVKHLKLKRRHGAQPPWDGQPLQGKTIIVHAEQGLGDTIQFVRYLHLVKERGGTVLFECQPALGPLLRGNVSADQLIPIGAPFPPADVQAPLLSLPDILGTRLETVPANAPYLRADPSLVESWRQELAPLHGFKIGIAWQGNSAHAADRYRSFPLTQFASLARVPGVQLVSLQKGEGAEQLQEWVEGVVNPADIKHKDAGRKNDLERASSILDLGDRLDAAGAFLDTAAIMMNLDLVIAVDSAVAHLAGALGVPVWLVLSITPDWRWLLDRADSPWYPTMVLFRQRRFAEWNDVFERMARELSRLVEGRSGG